jgi:uncharacterized damage-inducible protein DinB
MDLLDRLLGHDAWTTRQILERCHELPPAQLRQPIDAGHETVLSTLQHMIGNVRVWTDLMLEREVRSSGAPAEAVDDLIAAWDASYADFAAAAQALRDAGRLDDTYMDVLDSPPRAKSIGGTVAHVITHNMHHRAELLHMLARLGLSGLPEGDVLSWEQARGQQPER